MNRRIKSYSLIWLILFALFQAICFVTPGELAGMRKFDGAFWTGYGFLTLAFLGQYFCIYWALKEKNAQKLFYRLPLIEVSYTGLVLTLIFGGLVMVIPGFPSWAGIIICMLTLGFTAISVVKAEAAADIVERADAKVRTQTTFIKSLAADAEGLLANAKSDAVKAECKKVCEAVRYSDPVSSDALAGIEAQITVKFSAFSAAAEADDTEAVKAGEEELLALVRERNRRCRRLK